MKKQYGTSLRQFENCQNLIEELRIWRDFDEYDYLKEKNKSFF